MSGNLGGYQLITTVSKRVGGPYAFIVGLLGVGACLGGLGVYALMSQSKNNDMSNLPTYTVMKNATDEQGLKIKVGERIRIISNDQNVFIIEIIGRNDNPFAVSADFLKTNTTFDGEL